MRHFPSFRTIFVFALQIVFLTIIGSSAFSGPVYMPGFSASPFYSEQTKTYTFDPEIIITINAPAPMSFKSDLPVGLVLFALPNGNTTDQTIGKVLKTGDDWHYDIQHIGAQTRFLRNHITEYNVVTVYLETVQKSWPTWRGKYTNNAAIIKSVVDSLKSMFSAYNPFVVLTGHSGGGSFTFGYMNSVTEIPDEIDRISFLDSDYNYTDAYGAKLLAWLNGSPIQPLTNIHVNSYVDYSHGIRFLNAELYVDSVQNSAVEILLDINRYKLLSDEEGVMSQPGYLADTRIPATPKSWGVKTESETSLRIVTNPDSTAKEFVVFLSADGLNFSDSVVVPFDNPVVTGLQADSLYFIRMYARNVIGKSAATEVLAGYPIAKNIPVLIVNGFDRSTTVGNTYNFIRQHAKPVRAAGFPIASATNEAVRDGLLNLAYFQVVDYILGDESTVDETFSNSEQEFVKTFLQGGGRLLVSGAELAWDVDYKGSATDKDFCWNFLKMKYLADAPNNTSGTYYRAETVPGSPLGYIATFYFDNGTRGTINVKWPDVLGYTNGSSGFLKYTGFDTTGGFAGTCFSGVFTGGTQEGKVIALGFPFETIISESIRNDFMGKILTYFDVAGGIRKTDDLAVPGEFRLYQNYPNPFNSQTTIQFQIPKTEHITLKVLNLRGEEVATLTDRKEIAGSHRVNFDAGQLASGTYFYQLQSGNFRATKQLTLIK